jgi:hypothetical protein
MSETFKVGDSVLVKENRGRWRGPFKVAKQYKNGNLTLAGDVWPNDGRPRVEQYYPSGSRAGGDGWSPAWLVHDTPETRERIAMAKLRADVDEQIRHLAVGKWPRDRLKRLLAVLNEAAE